MKVFKNISIVALIILSFIIVDKAHAGACVVTTSTDSLSKTSTLRYKFKTVYNNSNGGCYIDSTYADKANGFDMYIAFQTKETQPTGAAVEKITLTSQLTLKPLFTTIVGNPSNEMVTDSDSDISYASTSGYTQSSGSIKDYGYVILDASGLDD